MTIALRGGHVFTPEGRVEPANVMITQDRIASVEAVQSEAPGNVRTVDATGLTILPGLIDLHTHLTTYVGVERESLARSAFVGAERARRALRTGITTVRDLGSYGQVDVELRDAIRAQQVAGPEVVCAGSFISITGGHGSPRSREADGVAEVRKAVREQLKANVDCVKLMCSGGVISTVESPAATQFTSAEIRAAVQEATAVGKATVAHAHPAEAIKRAVRAGVTSIEHGSFLDHEGAKLMAANDVFLVPTFAVFDIIGNSGRFPELGERARCVLGRKEIAFRSALEADVAWGVGSDSGAFSPVESFIDEMVYLVNGAGIGHKEVLSAASWGNAKLLGLGDRGCISPGYLADLVLVRGNPLSDLTALRRVEYTVRKGELLDWTLEDDDFG